MQRQTMQRNFYSIAILIFLGACKPAPAPEDAPTPPSPVSSEAATAPVAAAPREFGETLLWLDPLATCALKQVSKIHWSKEAVAKGPAAIELGDSNPGVFARIGDEGEKETGQWASPGSAVVLRGDDGEVRARQIFKGPNGCTTADDVSSKPAGAAPSAQG